MNRERTADVVDLLHDAMLELRAVLDEYDRLKCCQFGQWCSIHDETAAS